MQSFPRSREQHRGRTVPNANAPRQRPSAIPDTSANIDAIADIVAIADIDAVADHPTIDAAAYNPEAPTREPEGEADVRADRFAGPARFPACRGHGTARRLAARPVLAQGHRQGRPHEDATSESESDP